MPFGTHIANEVLLRLPLRDCGHGLVIELQFILYRQILL